MPTREQKSLGALLTGGGDPDADPLWAVDAKTERARRKALDVWREDAWSFLTGKDPDTGKPLWWTKDESDREAPYKPFPTHFDYLHEWVHAIQHERVPLFADKSRQLLITTATCLVIGPWDCGLHEARRWLFSKRTEKEAKEILRDKIRSPMRRLPAWVLGELRPSWTPELRVDFQNTESYVLGVAETVAEGEARGGTASGIVVDEAARQEYFEAIMAAALPMAVSIVGISTAAIGNAGALSYKAHLERPEDAA